MGYLGVIEILTKNTYKSSFWKRKLLLSFGVFMMDILEITNAVLWGIPVLLMILAVGIILTVRSRFAQIRMLPIALRNFFSSLKKENRNKQGISGYKALCTALAATVGTGNIAGVAGAIAIGGPGVIFWMWICALLGMITKFAEVTLALRYRKKNAAGEYVGGPMYMIRYGLPKKWHFLAGIYAFFGIVAAFGVGNATQVNAVVDGIKGIVALRNWEFGIWESLILGVILAALITAAFRKGTEGIGSWAEKLVPFASIIYILLAGGVLCLRSSRISTAIWQIIAGAFAPKAITCGVVSSAFLTLRVGASRGVFTNEAGMGTASIAHAAANAEHPVEQGLMGVVEVFLDTIVICTLTALVILCSGVPIPYGSDPGITLTMDAFSAVYGNWCILLLTALVCIFAFATILGWGLYGAKCAQYLFGEKAWGTFVFAQTGAVILGVILNTALVWLLAEIVNGLMAIPNLAAVLYLSSEFIKLLKEYPQREKAYRLP